MENQFKNPVKCINFISASSTLFMFSRFIAITIKLNGAIWGQVAIILLHINCKRRFYIDQAEERNILCGKMGVWKWGTRETNPAHSRAEQLLAFSVPALAFPKPHLKMALRQLSTVVLTSGASEEQRRWGSAWGVKLWPSQSPRACWSTWVPAPWGTAWPSLVQSVPTALQPAPAQ